MADHHGTTVTFLFTDIEGSTKRWEQYPAAMNIAVARHDALLRSIIEAHNGYVFKTIGDAFCAAFASAAQALEAVVDAQRAVEAGDWGEVSPLRVRMALHTGAAQERDRDYFGPTVNRVARILSVGHGGQTLLSAATQELVRDALPAGVGFLDMGDHRLKDLARAERIFQLTAPDLPGDFPALKSLNRQIHNLPVHPTPLIGRDQELDAVRGLLRNDEVRLVTLSGPGGTGKTRLALQVAAESLDDYIDGVFFIPLAAATDTESVITAIAHTLGLKETAGTSQLANLQDHLRDKKAMLVLDNFEQVTASASMVADLLATCPQIKMLITSRIVLRLRGEREFAVLPLSVPKPHAVVSVDDMAKYPAIELFVQRAQAAKPSFDLTAENAAAVVEICTRLDGLPLALELAAARIKLLTPQAMLGHLQNRLKLLTGGARDLPERQRTLRDAIAWSYDMLDSGEQALFRRLAVFPGGCTLDAALAICVAPDDAQQGIDIDVFDGLTSLLDKSLLRQEEDAEEPRFLLLQTIREYGLERLTESRELEPTEQRHADFYSGLLRALGDGETSNDTVGARQCEAEHDNLRAALDWLLDHNAVNQAATMAIDLAPFWERQGRFSEAREYLERCITRENAPQNLPVMAKLTGWMGWFLHLQGDNPAALEYQQRSLEQARAGADKEGEADALNNLGLIAQDRGDTTDARALFENSLEMARELGDAARQARRLSNLGLLAIEEQRHDEANRYLEEAHASYRAIDDTHGTAVCLCNLGELALRRQDWTAAQAFAVQSLELFRQLEDRRGIAYTLMNQAEAAMQQGNGLAVEPLLDEAIAIAWETGMQRLVPTLLEARGQAQLTHDALRDAMLSFAAADCFRERLHIPRSADEETALAPLMMRLQDTLGGEAVAMHAAVDKLDAAAIVARALAIRY